jgi:hypothetical protein
MSTIVATNIQDRVSSISVPIVAVINQRTNYGLVPSNNSGDITNDIDFTAGKCWDTTGTNYITVAALTKQADAPWAAGTNQGMMDTGTFAADTCYYFWAIYKDSDGTGDIIMSLADDWASVTKTLITGYTTGQLIHALPSLAGSIVWPSVNIVEEEVQYLVTSPLYQNEWTTFVHSSLTTDVAIAATTGYVPALSLGKFITNVQTDGTLVTTLAAGLADASAAGGGVTTSYFYGSSNIRGILGAVTVMTDASQQVAVGITYTGGSPTLTVYVSGYMFMRRFNGT